MSKDDIEAVLRRLALAADALKVSVVCPERVRGEMRDAIENVRWIYPDKLSALDHLRIVVAACAPADVLWRACQKDWDVGAYNFALLEAREVLREAEPVTQER